MKFLQLLSAALTSSVLVATVAAAAVPIVKDVGQELGKSKCHMQLCNSVIAKCAHVSNPRQVISHINYGIGLDNADVLCDSLGRPS
jgi:hypothetical protein